MDKTTAPGVHISDFNKKKDDGELSNIRTDAAVCRVITSGEKSVCVRVCVGAFCSVTTSLPFLNFLLAMGT